MPLTAVQMETQMKRAPLKVLICGIISAAFGSALLVVSGQVDGLVGLAVAIIAIGLLLVGIWLRSALRRPGPEGPEGLPASPLPGPWFPYAVLGVAVALGCWLTYWTKFR